MFKVMMVMLAVGGLCLMPASGQEGGGVAAPVTAQVDTKKALSEVNGIIEDSIKLLELKDYAGALRKLAGPIAEKIEKDGKLDRAAEALKAGMGDELLKGLKATRDMKPSIEGDGQAVIFDLTEKFPDSPRMAFRRWVKGWYLD